MKLKFIGSQPVKGNVVSFIFEPAEPFSWKPGQYMHYVLPHTGADDRGTERWFTNSAAPSEGKVMISTRIEQYKSSSFKHALQALKVGDELEADGPEGDFTVDDDSRNYIFVAAGIGITPFRSILTEAHAQNKQLRVNLLYANRDGDIPFQDELERLAVDNTNLKIEYFISPVNLDSNTIKQHVDATQKPLVYISGPELVVKSLAAGLETLGVSPDDVKVDDFPGYEGI